MSNITQDVIALNDYTQERRRTTSSGTKSRYTITVDAQPILHNLSETNLGAGPAAAIQAAIQKQIQAITEVAKPSTILRRQSAKRAIDSGSNQKRYSGGRIGAMPPSGSVRLFNDSGRLARGIFVRQNPREKNWTINVAANRLDPTTFSSTATFLLMVERLRALVPVLANPLTDIDVVNAIDDGIDGLLLRKVEDGKQLKHALLQARLAAVKAL